MCINEPLRRGKCENTKNLYSGTCNAGNNDQMEQLQAVSAGVVRRKALQVNETIKRTFLFFAWLRFFKGKRFPIVNDSFLNFLIHMV